MFLRLSFQIFQDPFQMISSWVLCPEAEFEVLKMSGKRWECWLFPLNIKFCFFYSGNWKILLSVVSKQTNPVPTKYLSCLQAVSHIKSLWKHASSTPFERCMTFSVSFGNAYILTLEFTNLLQEFHCQDMQLWSSLGWLLA